MTKVIVKIKADKDKYLPTFGTEYSAGADLKANLLGLATGNVVFGECKAVINESSESHVTIKPNGRYLFDCGFSMELPIGYEAQIRPRSGFSTKQGAHIPNSVGTIDCDYRGRVMVAIHNMSSTDITVYQGDRIAQMIIKEVPQVEYVLFNELSDTVRGDGGFGHTGKQ